MAIAYVTSSSFLSTVTNDTAKTVSFAISPGDCIVVVVSVSGGMALGTVTDSSGTNVYTKSAYYTAANPWTAVYTCIAGSAATSVTCNWTTGLKHNIEIVKYSGVASIGNATTSHGVSTSATITNSQSSANNWTVAGFAYSGVGAAPIATSGTLRVSVQSNGGGQWSGALDNTGSTTVTLTANITNSTNWSIGCVELVAASTATALTIPANSGSIAETGTAASFHLARKMAAASVAFSETGTAATLRRGLKCSALSVAFTETGTAALFHRGVRPALASGSFVEAGTAATLRRGYKFAALAGSFIETGTVANLSTSTGAKHWTITAASGTYTESGTLALFHRSIKCAATTVAFTETGTAALFHRGLRMASASGSFALVGTNVTLTLTGQKVISAQAGTFAVSGTPVTLRRTRRMTAASRAMSLTGTAVALHRGWHLDASTVGYVVVGTAADFSVAGNVVMPASTGTYECIGSTADLRVTLFVLTSMTARDSVNRLAVAAKLSYSDPQMIMDPAICAAVTSAGLASSRPVYSVSPGMNIESVHVNPGYNTPHEAF